MTEIEHLREENKRLRHSLEVFTEVTANAVSTLELNELLDRLAERFVKIVNADGCVIALFENGKLIIRTASGIFEKGKWIGREIPLAGSFSGKVYTEKRVIFQADSHLPDSVLTEDLRMLGIRSSLGIPLKTQNQILGVFSAHWLKPYSINEEEIHLLEITAERCATAIFNAKLFNEVKSFEKLLELTLLQAPVAIILLDTDAKIQTWNFKAEEIFGYRADEVVGKNIIDLIVPESIRQEIYENIWLVLKSGEKSVHSINKNKTKQGVEITCEWYNTILTDEDGNFIGVLSMARDITHEKEMEEKIRQQAELINLVPDAVLIRDLDDTITFWNKSAEEIYGWSADEVIGKKITEFLYNEDGLKNYFEAKNLTLEKGFWLGELKQRKKDGKEIIVLSRFKLLRDKTTGKDFILVNNTDITEKKKLETLLTRAQRFEAIGTLAAGVAHDLNNVLQPIIIAAEILRTKITMDEYIKNVIDIISTQALRGATIVKQILGFAKGIKGEAGIVQVKHLIRDLEVILKETFPRNIKIEIDYQKDLWTTKGDATQITQVLMNLCVNARDAMPNGGTLRIKAENINIDSNYISQIPGIEPGPFVLISVEDTGTGIPKEIIDKIFDPFFTTKEPGKGTGLGLAIVYSIIKEHRGFINVYSQPGKGTIFKIYLPAVEIEERKEREEEIPELPAGDGKTILIVDDESAVREMIKTILQEYNYKVITAGDGAEALIKFIQNKDEIKLILMDMMMPIMNGDEAIKTIRKIDNKVKIIAMSGLSSPGAIDEFVERNVEAIIQKPFSASDFIKALSSVLK